MGFFITGTDTGAGKTVITSYIVRALRAERIDAVGYKPICCGDRNDALELRDASDGIVTEDEVNPIWLKTAACPHVAAMFERVELTRGQLLEGYEALRAKHEHVITEGVGGWLVPIRGMEYTVAELAKDIGDPVLVVVGNRLGALNHTIMTIETMRARGVEPAGLIFNNLVDELDTATVTNKGIIEDLTGVEVLTDVIHNQENIEAWPFMELLGL